MVEASVGRLEQVPLREVWAHETLSLTPWLLRNAVVLADALGIDLELREAEHAVGGFNLDLVGVDRATGATVIVENQLEGSDHSHLGQLLTYAGGTDPTTIVWVAPRFRDEHRAALEWLNLHTEPGVRFFAVRITAVRIGNSLPAPLLEVVVRPNDWEKTVRTSTATTTGTAWSWDGVLEHIRGAEGDAVADAIEAFVHAHEDQGTGAGATYGTGASPSVNATYRAGGVLIRPWSIWLNQDRALLSVNFEYLVSTRHGPSPDDLQVFVDRVRGLPGVGAALDHAAAAGWRKRPSLPVRGLLDDPSSALTLIAAFADICAVVPTQRELPSE